MAVKGVGYSGVKGLDEVMAKLNKKILEIEGRNVQGMIKGAIHIRRETENEAKFPVTPVDLGNLRASWFVVTASGATQAGKSTNAFNGPKAAEIARNHQEAISMAKSKAQGLSHKGHKAFVILGYSANYAYHVHENLEARNWKRRGSGPKWFEAAVNRNKKELIKIIKENARV